MYKGKKLEFIVSAIKHFEVNDIHINYLADILYVPI